ncbi:hypothetical protein EHS25_010143 [Saitozyma podzolica]|uniref:Ubiquitin-like domain-containing protein n=1 Tax=Saitozyma podzolica TaxID=1890683 RepID=A0A427YIQ8_9TREE|nr:hypothetical protein EHS25_010143 [Saitozyma podzolica]
MTEDKFTIKIVGHEDAYTSHIKVKPSTPLRKVFAGWAELHKLNWRYYRFMYDGVRLHPDDDKGHEYTVGEVDLEEDAMVEVMLEALGGAAHP